MRKFVLFLAVLSVSTSIFSQKEAVISKDPQIEKMLKDVLTQQGVTLIGGDIDEAPMAYKDIRDVMQSQQELVNIEGIFQPKIVRMAG